MLQALQAPAPHLPETKALSPLVTTLHHTTNSINISNDNDNKSTVIKTSVQNVSVTGYKVHYELSIQRQNTKIKYVL